MDFLFNNIKNKKNSGIKINTPLAPKRNPQIIKNTNDNNALSLFKKLDSKYTKLKDGTSNEIINPKY